MKGCGQNRDKILTLRNRVSADLPTIRLSVTCTRDRAITEVPLPGAGTPIRQKNLIMAKLLQHHKISIQRLFNLAAATNDDLFLYILHCALNLLAVSPIFLFFT